MVKTYEIFESNLSGLSKRIGVLSARSVKLGGQPITMEVGTARDIPHADDPNRLVRKIEVSITGETPKFAGWSFLATIAHTPDGNVIRAVPGFEVEPRFREGKPCCDHCKTNRNRLDTFVVRHDDGQVMQVGSSCLKDFLGHSNPHTLTTAAEVLLRAFDLVNGAGSSGMNDIYRINLLTYLEWVAAVTLKTGYYVTRKSAGERGCQATSEIAYSAMMHLDRVNSSERSAYEPSQEAKELASAALNFVIVTFAPALAEDVDDDELAASVLANYSANMTINDFQHNLLTCAKAEAIEPRFCGIAAYIIEYYRKEKGLNIHKDEQLNENFTRIFKMFQAAKGSQLKRPAIRLVDNNQKQLCLSLASDMSKNAGWVYVKSGAGYDSDYYGKISPEGRFLPVAACPTTVKTQLAEFALNPEEIARRYGQLTGKCCFCGRTLKDERSTHVGFGPICAASFGLVADWKQAKIEETEKIAA